MMMNDRRKHIVVLSGAGNGLGSLYSKDGLWSVYDLMEVASAQAWKKDYERVINFFNRLRWNLVQSFPSAAHYLIAALEHWYDVTVVTLNIDNLHEMAGSSRVIHLLGELTKARPEDTYSPEDGFSDKAVVEIGYEDIRPGQRVGKNRSRLRPHVVLLGESIPLLGEAALEVGSADILLVIDFPPLVEPASILFDEIRSDCDVYVIGRGDVPVADDLGVFRIEGNATNGMHTFFREMGHDITTIGLRNNRMISGLWSTLNETQYTNFFVFAQGGRFVARHGAWFWDLEEYDDRDERETSRNWSRDGRRVDIRGEERTRIYYRPDGLPKHKIIGWYPPFDVEYFYKWYPDGLLKSITEVWLDDQDPDALEKTAIVYRYDKSGLLLSERQNDKLTRYKYTFDEKGNWIIQERDEGEGIEVRIERDIHYGVEGFQCLPDLEEPNRDFTQLNDWTR